MLVLLLLWALFASASVRLANDYLYDRALSSHERFADNDIVIVAIDEDSLAQLGQWPWPRTVHADFLRQLSAAQPRGILFDVLFTEPAEGDAELNEVMKNVANLASPLLLLPKNNGFVVESDFDVIRPIVHGDKLGHVAVNSDADGVVRRVQLDYKQKNERFNALALQVLNSQKLGEYVVPFNVRQGSYRTVSYRSVLDGEVDVAFLRDKYVLVGAMASGLGEQFVTPVSGMDGRMSGVEIHANILDGLKNNIVLSFMNHWIWSVLPIVVLMFGFLALRERFHFIWLGFVSTVFVVLNLFLMWCYYIWLPPVLTVGGIFLAYLLWSWRRLAVLVTYAQNEWYALLTATGSLLPLLSTDLKSRFRPHEIELSMDYAHRLHDLVSTSLQKLPTGLLVVDLVGNLHLCNREASHILQRVGFDKQKKHRLQEALYSLDDSIVWLDTHDLDWLDGVELNGGAGVFSVHIVPIRYEDQLTMWLVNLLELTNERHAQSVRADLIRFLSHDLRTPQVSILAVMDLHPMLDGEVRAQVTHHVQRTLNWADDVVRLTEAKNLGLNATEFNFAVLAQEVVDEIYAQAQSKNINISLDDECFDDLWLHADKSLLSRALINLLTNAVRYSDAGSGVMIDFVASDLEIRVRVKDQGVGMDALHVAALIAGSQIKNTHLEVDAAGSLGVGLHMVYAVIQSHNGRVEVSSEVGQGSVFTLILPRSITVK